MICLFFYIFLKASLCVYVGIDGIFDFREIINLMTFKRQQQPSPSKRFRHVNLRPSSSINKPPLLNSFKNKRHQSLNCYQKQFLNCCYQNEQRRKFTRSRIKKGEKLLEDYYSNSPTTEAEDVKRNSSNKIVYTITNILMYNKNVIL